MLNFVLLITNDSVTLWKIEYIKQDQKYELAPVWLGKDQQPVLSTF